MKRKMKIIGILYVAVPLILGVIITYAGMYFLHPLDSNDWYRYGFPVGWKNTEATGVGYDWPTVTFYNPTGFVLDVLFWYGIALVIIVVVARRTRGVKPQTTSEEASKNGEDSTQMKRLINMGASDDTLCA